MMCKDCMHHAKRGNCIWCTLNHYFPRKEHIAFAGCVDFKEEKIDLLNWREEEENEQEK